jgi:peptidoglycan/LPS O-acetylase OafA/YrhL
MAGSRFNFVGLLIVLLAAPIWILVAIEVSLRADFSGSLNRYVVAPFVLGGLTAAIHRLLRPRKNSWPLSALIAGVGTLAVLAWSAG